MPQTLQKLQPDRDLQCYYLTPSANAAMSQASPTGFTVSGSWRQQFDWAVIEWNRDNNFEHPLFRNLPDGDLSGLQLTYEETRDNCIPLDSTLFHTVDWPYLRVWADSISGETIYFVPLTEHATAIAGSYTAASAVFTFQGSPTASDYVEVAWIDEHYTYQLSAGDTLATAISTIASAINSGSATMTAAANGAQLTITAAAASLKGSNGNRVGVYANVT